MILYSHSR